MTDTPTPIIDPTAPPAPAPAPAPSKKTYEVTKDFASSLNGQHFRVWVGDVLDLVEEDAKRFAAWIKAKL